MSFARRIGLWLVIVAFATALALLLTGCAQPDAPDRMPEPTPIVRSFIVPFQGGDVYVTEFRDSAGRTCVLAKYSSYGVALDCGYPASYAGAGLPVLEYEQLEKRPL